MLTFLLRYWKPLAGVAAVLTLLLLYRAQLQKAEARGYDRAAVEFEAAAQAQAEAWKAQVDAANARQAKAQAQIDKAERASRDRIRTHYRDNPSTCGISPAGVGLLWQSDSERAATYATGRGYALRKAPAPDKGNGAE